MKIEIPVTQILEDIAEPAVALVRSHDAQIEREIVRLLADREQAGIVNGTIGVAFIFCSSIFYGTLDIFWPFLMYISSQLLFGYVTRKKLLAEIAADRPIDKYRIPFELSFATMGAGWASLIWPIRDNFTTDTGSLVIFVIIMMAIVFAAVVVGMHRRAMCSYLIGVALMFIPAFSTPLPVVGYYFLFSMPVLFFLFWQFGSKIGEQLYESVRIKIENQTLSLDLARTNSELEDALAEARELSKRDSLTGLYNRRAFEELLMKKSARKKSGEQHYLVLMDLDNFKKINDNNGHHTGDAVLVATAKMAQEILPRRTVVARWGGEEFIAKVSAANVHDVVEKVDLLRVALTGMHSEDWHDKVTISMSFGIARIEPEIPMSTMIAIADNALYAAKAAGRNCIKIAG